MEKLRDINSLWQHLFSANRRHKLKILAKEFFQSAPIISKKNSSYTQQFPDDPPSANWSTKESRAIDVKYFQQRTVPLVQDYFSEDGIIHADHDYIVQKLYGASTYTNELTHRTVFTREGESVELLSCKGPGRRARGPSYRRVPITKSVQGVTANLYGVIATAEGNYLHWFVDAMARLFMIKRYHSLDSIDYVLVPPLKYDFHWDTLEALGFDRTKIIELQPLECIEFECLLASNWPRGRGSDLCPGWVIDRYREVFLKRAESVKSVAGKKVYVSRRDAPTRMFTNETEVCEILERHGFDIVELTPLNVWEKIAVFRDAEYVISQTGAGLTNLMFCSSNAKVLELVDERFVYPLYASLITYGGGTHYPHFFSNESMLSRTNAVVAKSSLDIDKFEQALISYKFVD